MISLWAVVGLTGCVSPPATPGGHATEPNPFCKAAQSGDRRSVARLMEAVVGLDRTVDRKEAERFACDAHVFSRQLAREYKAVRPPVLHNLLVNCGLKQRGLCYEWADDLHTLLESGSYRTLELHRVVTRRGTLREHNAVGVSPRGRSFREGILLDPWRGSGRLVWSHIKLDHRRWDLFDAPAP